MKTMKLILSGITLSLCMLIPGIAQASQNNRHYTTPRKTQKPRPKTPKKLTLNEHLENLEREHGNLDDFLANNPVDNEPQSQENTDRVLYPYTTNNN